MLNIKSFPVILLHWVCLISGVPVRMCACEMFITYRSGCKVMLLELFLLHIPPSLPPSSSTQLRYMMVMTGYPDFLLKPELIDQEYGVSLQLPV